MKVNIAILASGSGTNAENIMKYFKDSPTMAIALVLSDKKDAYVLERARNNHTPTGTFSKTELESTDVVLKLLADYQIDFIVLAGFLLKVSDSLLNAFPGRIMNIHPALLPRYGGKGMYGSRVHQAVVAAAETESGITIHYVNEHYDEGNIIFQAKCPVFPTDSPDDVAKRVHELEYKFFPGIIEQTVVKEFNLPFTSDHRND